MTSVAAATATSDSDGPTTGTLRLRVSRFLLSGVAALNRLPVPLRLPLKPIGSILEGISLGLLRLEDMDRLVAETYAAHPQFYDPKKYRLPYEEQMLPQLTALAGSRRRMLDAFCGQGREAELFAKNGFQVTAIDHLEWMINAARRNAVASGFEAAFLTADFFSFVPDEPFELVYTSCWMYSTCRTSARRVAFLRQCGSLVGDNGLIVMSYVADECDSKVAAVTRWLSARIAGFLTHGNRRTEIGERIYSGLFWHHLSETRVAGEVAAAGLQTVHVISAAGAAPTFRFLRRQTSAEKTT